MPQYISLDMIIKHFAPYIFTEAMQCNVEKASAQLDNNRCCTRTCKQYGTVLKQCFRSSSAYICPSASSGPRLLLDELQNLILALPSSSPPLQVCPGGPQGQPTVLGRRATFLSFRSCPRCAACPHVHGRRGVHRSSLLRGWKGTKQKAREGASKTGLSQ